MGRAIIIPGIDWSGNNLGTVSNALLTISGSTTVMQTGSFGALLGGSAVPATWSISDTSIATISSSTGNSITVTAVSNGTVRLTATYEGETTYVDLSIYRAITEEDITSDLLKYYSTATNKTRTGILLPIDNASSFHGTFKNINANNTVKLGIQLWDAEHEIPGNDPSNPSSGDYTDIHITWDSGWITAEQETVCDYTKNKTNTIGSAASTGAPATLNIAFTYVSGNSGMPTLNEILSTIEFEYYPS